MIPLHYIVLILTGALTVYVVVDDLIKEYKRLKDEKDV